MSGLATTAAPSPGAAVGAAVMLAWVHRVMAARPEQRIPAHSTCLPILCKRRPALVTPRAVLRLQAALQVHLGPRSMLQAAAPPRMPAKEVAQP